MENYIEQKNKKILVFGTIFFFLIGFLSHFINKMCFNNKIKKIDRLFESESFITVNNNSTPSELTWNGMENIGKYMELKDWSKNTFIDLESGNGRTLAYAILNGFKEAKGTEIVQARHEYAMKMREKLDDYMKDKIKLSKSDLFKLDPSYFPTGSVIFISNLVFSEKTNQKLINFLSKNTPSDVIIILSALPNDLRNFKLIEQLDLSQSHYVLTKK